MLTLAVGAAVASAAGFAVSTSLQHHAASGVPAPGGDIARLLSQLARRPLWLLGVLASAIAFALHGVAVHLGTLVIVQPVVVSGIVLAVPIRDALAKRRSAARDLIWVSMTAVGLALFIVVTNPAEGNDGARVAPATWLVGAGAAAITIAVSVSRRMRTARRQGLLLSIAAGVAFGLSAGLLKMTGLTVVNDPTGLVGHWPAWSLLAIGTAGFVLNQRSYQLTPLSMTMPLLNVVNVLVSVLFGWYVFDEKPAHDPASLVTALATLVLMYVGVRRLATPAPPAEPVRGIASPYHDERPDRAGSIVIISAGVGAGHDGAARELRARLVDRGHRVSVVDFLDLLPGPAGRLLRSTYRAQLRVAPRTWEWVLTATAHGSGMSTVAARLARLAEPGVLGIVGAQTPAVVSTYPLASQVLGHLRTHGRIPAPVITYLTDMSVHPLWVSAGVDAHLALDVVPADQARRLGAARVGVTRPSVSPRFRPRSGVRAQQDARRRFGLPPVGRLALVTTGSWGVGEIESSVDDIVATGLVTPVIACGGNHALRARLEAAGAGIALGWVTDMPTLMHACDVVIQNAGGLTCLEALASGLPVISYRCLPGHGRANAAALELAGWCPWARNTRQLAELLGTMSTQRPTALPSHTAAEDAAVVIDRLAHASGGGSTRGAALAVKA